MRVPSDEVEETTQINGSQGPLGASWGACGSLVELPWSLLRRAGSHLGAAWGHGGRSGGPLGALLGPLGALLGRAWGPWNPNGSEVKNIDFLLVFVRFGRSPPPRDPPPGPPPGPPPRVTQGKGREGASQSITTLVSIRFRFIRCRVDFPFDVDRRRLSRSIAIDFPFDVDRCHDD